MEIWTYFCVILALIWPTTSFPQVLKASVISSPNLEIVPPLKQPIGTPVKSNSTTPSPKIATPKVPLNILPRLNVSPKTTPKSVQKFKELNAEPAGAASDDAPAYGGAPETDPASAYLPPEKTTKAPTGGAGIAPVKASVTNKDTAKPKDDSGTPEGAYLPPEKTTKAPAGGAAAAPMKASAAPEATEKPEDKEDSPAGAYLPPEKSTKAPAGGASAAPEKASEKEPASTTASSNKAEDKDDPVAPAYLPPNKEAAGQAKPMAMETTAMPEMKPEAVTYPMSMKSTDSTTPATETNKPTEMVPVTYPQEIKESTSASSTSETPTTTPTTTSTTEQTSEKPVTYPMEEPKEENDNEDEQAGQELPAGYLPPKPSMPALEPPQDIDSQVASNYYLPPNEASNSPEQAPSLPADNNNLNSLPPTPPPISAPRYLPPQADNSLQSESASSPAQDNNNLLSEASPAISAPRYLPPQADKTLNNADEQQSSNRRPSSSASSAFSSSSSPAKAAPSYSSAFASAASSPELVFALPAYEDQQLQKQSLDPFPTRPAPPSYFLPPSVPIFQRQQQSPDFHTFDRSGRGAGGVGAAFNYHNNNGDNFNNNNYYGGARVLRQTLGKDFSVGRSPSGYQYTIRRNDGFAHVSVYRS